MKTPEKNTSDTGLRVPLAVIALCAALLLALIGLAAYNIG